MTNFILVFHVILAFIIVGLVLIQHGKGAEVGASFGSGASNTMFGSQGAGSFLARTTVVAAIIFAVTSFALTKSAYNSANIDLVNVEELSLPEDKDNNSTKKGFEEKEIKNPTTEGNFDDAIPAPIEIPEDDMPEVKKPKTSDDLPN